MTDRIPRPLGFTSLRSWLRHRHPMVLLDRVLDHEPGEFLDAVLSVSGNLDCIAGHFPERGIYPGTNLTQAFAQCAIVLYQTGAAPLREDELTLITRADARFFKIVVPGDRVILHAEVERIVKGLFMFRGDARVEGTRVAAFRVSLVRVNESQLGNPLW